MRQRKQFRPIYHSKEIVEQWNSRIGKIVNLVDRRKDLLHDLPFAPDIKDELSNDFREFDPLRSYTAQWWKDSLGCTTGHERFRVDTPLMRYSSLDVRWEFIDFLSFSIPTTEALQSIKEFVGQQSLVEFMCGSGYWAYLLRKEMRMRVIATDKHNSQYKVSKQKTFLPVRRWDVSKRSKPPENAALMFSWIPYCSNAADKMLTRMTKGQKLIIIGEGEGGCTATDSTFKILQKHFEFVDRHNLTQFYGLHDNMEFFVKQ